MGVVGADKYEFRNYEQMIRRGYDPKTPIINATHKVMKIVSPGSFQLSLPPHTKATPYFGPDSKLAGFKSEPIT